MRYCLILVGSNEMLPDSGWLKGDTSLFWLVPMRYYLILVGSEHWLGLVRCTVLNYRIAGRASNPDNSWRTRFCFTRCMQLLTADELNFRYEWAGGEAASVVVGFIRYQSWVPADQRWWCSVSSSVCGESRDSVEFQDGSLGLTASWGSRN